MAEREGLAIDRVGPIPPAPDGRLPQSIEPGSGAPERIHAVDGAVVVDAIKDVSVFVLCDDEAIETGALVVASRSTASLERGGEDVLAALRFAGFNVTFDEGLKLVCDGECHEDRVLRR